MLLYYWHSPFSAVAVVSAIAYGPRGPFVSLLLYVFTIYYYRRALTMTGLAMHQPQRHEQLLTWCQGMISLRGMLQQAPDAVFDCSRRLRRDAEAVPENGREAPIKESTNNKNRKQKLMDLPPFDNTRHLGEIAHSNVNPRPGGAPRHRHWCGGRSK